MNGHPSRVPRCAIAAVRTAWARFAPSEQLEIGPFISPLRLLGPEAVLGVIESLGTAGRLTESALFDALSRHSGRLKAMERRAEREF